MSNFRARVISKLAEMTVMHEVIIDGGTERYGDLRISGEDLWQFLDWVALQFGTDFSDMNASLY